MYAALFLSAAFAVSAVPPTAFDKNLSTALVEPGQHGKDEVHKLGRKKIGDYTVSVIMIGDAEAGEKVKLDIKLIDAKSDPKALRVWIGVENTSEEAKTLLVKGETTYAGEVTAPTPMPKGAMIWVELETDMGKSKGSYEPESHGHKH